MERLVEEGEHADVEVDSQDRSGKHSIAKELLPEIDTLLASGLAPKRIRNNLRLKYKKKPKFLDLIPSVHQIQNRKRKHTRERLGAIKFETAADLSEFTNAHLLPPSKEDALALDKDELIVLPDGVFSLEDGMGFVFSSVGSLENVVRAKAAWGSSMPSETDGTYKIVYNRWPCLVYGTHTLKYNKERNCIQHSFVPFAFMMAKSNGNSDRATEIRKAYEDVYACNWTTCWPHIARKPFVEFRAYMRDNSDDFQHAKDEKQLAVYVSKEYLSAPHNKWFYTTSGIPGVEPSSQPIESYNKDTKQNKILKLRCQMDELLTKSLPELLWLDAWVVEV
ncbi:hypothetical protein CYMTET_32063 [Cymbomonas tetramitiformis]|uniref:Uncharacterized protein n=1 Tax=Cymbomonas tetramitiformis TaxID=36881 RepID=A0AAE0FFX3_9CHLO|nr:hypothetical protein CYMTET_32063 [Cymbomonas tetramitiformis]